MNAPVTSAPDRTRYLGSSDVAAVLGISPWKSALDLYLDKVEPREEDGGNAKAKARGSRLEPYIRDMIADEYGLVTIRANERYQDTALPFLAAEIDCELVDSPEATQIDNGEIKTVHPFKTKEWGEQLTDELPLHYAAQVQFALGIEHPALGRRERTHVFALIGDDLKRYVIERDDVTIAAIRERCAAFWTEHVLARRPPEPDYQHAGVLRTLQRLYPGTNGEVIPATDAHRAWRHVIETANKMKAHYEEIYEGARAHLLAEMGDSTAVEFDDGQAFIRKRIQKKAYAVDYPATSYIDFRLGKLKTPT